MDLKLAKLTNDLSIVDGSLETIKGVDEAGQRIRDRLLTFRGEWFLNLAYGVDYIGKIMVKNARTGIVAAHFRSEILKSVTGRILEFTSTIKDRVFNAKYKILIEDETITGEITQ